MVLDAALLNTEHYKGKVEQPSLTLGVVAIGKEAFELPLTTVTSFTYKYIYIYIYIERERESESGKREEREEARRIVLKNTWNFP